MNTLHFKYAVEVERTGSISQAADNLFMAQPNLSKAIRELEETFGITIFRRTSKGVVATPEGSEFLSYAKILIQQLEKMEAIGSPDGIKPQSLRIAIPTESYISYAVCNLISELDITHPIDVRITQTGSVPTIKKVADSSYALGVVRYNTTFEKYYLDFLKEKGLDYEAVWEFDCLAIMSSMHPLANCTAIDANQLRSEYIEIIHKDSIVPYLSAPDLIRRNPNYLTNKRIKVYDRGTQLDLLSKVPGTYMWSPRLPKEQVERYSLVQLPCTSSEYRYKDILIYPKGYTFTDVERKFINCLFKERNEVAFTK